jgi:SNF family Na+-dependent transporter
MENEAYDIDAKVDGTSEKQTYEGTKESNDNENGSNFLQIDDCSKVEEPEREEWNNQIEFLLSTIGYAIGLGNIWRFPYLCYINGGGTFLIPYLIMLVLVALPMFFMEMVLGQYSRQGPIKAFGRIAPISKGVGAAMLCASCYVCTYYNVVTSWTLYYIVKGFTSELPWSSCTNESSRHCVENFTEVNITNDPFSVDPREDFFLSQMLGLDKEIYDWNNYGGLRWQMVLCLLGAWLIIGLSLIKGIKSSGKVIYSILNVL